MRFITLTVLCLSILLAAPLGASAKSKKDKGPEMIAKLLAKVIEAAGDRVSTETEMVDSELMGNGNEIVQIESLTLNITIGDVVINKNSGGDGGGTEFAHRLLDFMGMMHEQMGRGAGGDHGPDMPMPPGMKHPDMNMPMGGPHGMDMSGHPGVGKMKGGQGKGLPKMDGHPKMEGQGKGHPKMDGPGQMMQGKPHGDNPGFHPEVWEMLHNIPMDVDPEFFGLIMRIGTMAMESDRVREHLEGFIERIEQGKTDRRPHGR